MIEGSGSHSPWGLRLATGAALAGSVLGVTACEDSPRPEVFAEETAAVSPGVTPPEDERGPCKPSPIDNKEIQDQGAERCMAAMKAGEVALVAFDIPTNTAERIADDMEKTLKTTSKGLIRVSVEVVEASDEAKKDVADTKGFGDCLNTEAVEDNMVSQAAARTMPELQDKDMIVAITGAASCSANELGKMDPFTQRLADVYEVDTKNVKVSGAVAAHELGHTFGLGHSGEVLGAGENDVFSRYIEGNNRNVDLTKHLASTKYYAYSYPKSLMGAPASTEGLESHPIDLAALSLPQAELRGEQFSPAKNVGADWLNLDTKAAAAGHFGSVELDTPVDLIAEETGIEYTFDKIAVLPSLEDGKTGPIGGADLMLFDSHHNSAAVGSIIRDSGRKTTTIVYGSKRIEIRWADNALGVRVR